MADVYFRFGNLNKLQKLTLEREITGAFAVSCEQTAKIDGYVSLTPLVFDDINMFAVRQQIAAERCSIVVKINPSTEQSELQLPQCVNQMLKHIDCVICFQLGNGQ